MTRNKRFIFFVILIQKLSVKSNLFIVKGVSACDNPGFVIYFFFLSFLFLSYYHVLPKEAAGIIISSIAMLIFGIIDDWRKLPVSVKLIPLSGR